MQDQKSPLVEDGWVGPTAVSFDDFYRDDRTGVTRAVVLVVGSRDLGCEAVDEAFARALARWDEVSGYDNPAGWVYRVAVNWGRSRLRLRSREAAGLFHDPSFELQLPEPELLQAVQGLPFKYRTVVVARFFLDWSIEQTARALSIPEGTVKTHQHRAVERLRKRLGEPS